MANLPPQSYNQNQNTVFSVKNLPQIPKLRRLANRLGTPLYSVEFFGNGVQIVYRVGDTFNSVSGEDADKCIDDEVKRLERNIRELEKLAREI